MNREGEIIKENSGIGSGLISKSDRFQQTRGESGGRVEKNDQNRGGVLHLVHPPVAKMTRLTLDAVTAGEADIPQKVASIS